MSKFAKVKMADILFLAGYSEVKILDAIRFPKCEKIQLISVETEPPPEEIEIKVFSGGTLSEVVVFTEIGEDFILETPVYPMLSYCDFGLSLTLGFSFGERFMQKLWGTYFLRIPTPAEWPVPIFLDIEKKEKD